MAEIGGGEGPTAAVVPVESGIGMLLELQLFPLVHRVASIPCLDAMQRSSAL